MLTNMFLYGYLPFLIIGLLSAAWYKWFSKDIKAKLGAMMAFVFAFVPITNIWWVLMGIGSVLNIPEIENSTFQKITHGIIMVVLYGVWFPIVWVIEQWQHLKQKFAN